ncbi:LETM1-related biofilm-associated protein [Myroides odoratimimus]|uniref:LETM1-related biofilm-associated protein n=1 Tax=Myroides odoratimimus TaxID=76832 RepID=UPI003D2F809D
MNPSTNGWIKKYFTEHPDYQIFSTQNCHEISTQIRRIGFSYGIIDIDELPSIYKNFKYTQEELSKICYLQLLEKIYYIYNNGDNQQNFIDKLIEFYEVFIPHKSNIFSSFFEEKNPYNKLENIFSIRCKEHFFSQSKNNDFVLNMILLFIDILAFEAYINEKTDPTIFIQHTVEQLKEITLSVKRNKEELSKKDLQLIDFLDKTNNSAAIDSIKPNTPISSFEANFMIDYIVCNSWKNDVQEIILPNFEEEPFLSIPYSQTMIEESIFYFSIVLVKNKYDYHYYKSSNLFDNVIKNSTSYIELLLTRNKTRLVNELQKNTQLMKLLVDSTHRDLNKEEKKMVKKQTIEVIKTIPSLAIFILPGGGILLPILLKFIPSLLPSSFNENTEQ